MPAIAGTFVKIEPVATRKVVRLHIECPIEQADQILRALGGYPDPANAKWVGIAALKAEPENTLKGGKLAQSAGIICNEGAFLQYVIRIDPDVRTKEHAVEWLKEQCNISSRAHLDHNDEAARIFLDIRSGYEAWLKVAA